ncbi:MAG: glyoxylate reductase, partial [Chloroflexi bacterium]|nr:glyoxylate reductase [Chloroflexota bacterium]
AEQAIPLLPLEEVLARADIVSLHVPLLPQTHHLINRDTLALLRPHAILINSSRGGVIDEKALLEALERKQLYRAVLDVREVEPPPLDDPLRHCASVILTPHIAGLTAEAQERTAHLLINDVLSVLAGGRAIGQVSLDEAMQLADQ